MLHVEKRMSEPSLGEEENVEEATVDEGYARLMFGEGEPLDVEISDLDHLSLLRADMRPTVESCSFCLIAIGPAELSGPISIEIANE